MPLVRLPGSRYVAGRPAGPLRKGGNVGRCSAWWLVAVATVGASPALAQWVEDEESAASPPGRPGAPAPAPAPARAPVPPPVAAPLPVGAPVAPAPSATPAAGEPPADESAPARPPEVWRDESPAAPVVRPRPPRVGFTGGLQLGSTIRSTEGPVPGVRAGLRLGLSRHAALSLYASWEFESPRPVSLNPGEDPVVELQHLLYTVARLELMTVSAFSRLLVPELSIGFLVGAGVLPATETSTTAPAFMAGLHLGMTRLRPSGWWFPFFLEVAYEVAGAPPSFRFAAGVGL